MKLLNIFGFCVFQFLSCFLLLAYIFGILNNYFSDKNNYCAMTYMYEYPQFVRITLDENKLVPQYGLYAYSEGRFTEKARKMWFDGIPVLFLTGNSGSHMQARSLASVALRKALSQGYEYHFDFFTISFNEELSGLYGGVLQSQTVFAANCISKILSLYKNNKFTKFVPTSVILIGHSMGGLIAKRLLAYPSTINLTNVAITLATPLEAPVINLDYLINEYYDTINLEWKTSVKPYKEIKERKFLISIGSGPRDMLVPASLTFSKDSHINVLATAIPGVWVTPDHVSMVWCKQLVMVVNRFLFSIIDPQTEQVTENYSKIATYARQYFQANRSMTLNPQIIRGNVTMQADAFWYEDNRRIYQIVRPEIDRTTHLMIRLVSFPQNRFVAVEAVNVGDKDWIFGCNAKNVYNSYRYCKQATSLSELSRWSVAAPDFGKRKLATINLHKLMDIEPDWTHVIVKVSPTEKPIVLNVDINDHASRVIDVNVPSIFSFEKQIIKAETEANSLYYELIISDFNVIHQAYLLYVEPTTTCKDSKYHVSAELHVPWASNHETYHYFTHLKRSPMKLRLFRSNPNVTYGLDAIDKVKVTLLFDPQCTFSISISTSWYHRLAQLSRNYTPVLVPYVAAIMILAARSSIISIKESGKWLSVHGALMSDGVKPYYVMVFVKLASMAVKAYPDLVFYFENASWMNLELQYFNNSLLVLPAYMVALGILNVVAAAILFLMMFSSQLALRLFFRIICRGGSGGLADKIASGLNDFPLVVSLALGCIGTFACSAASLAMGAAFYVYMVSKLYEEYLEDYFYKLWTKIAIRICCMFKSRQSKDAKISLVQQRKPNTTDTENLDHVKGTDQKDNLDKSDSSATDNKTTDEDITDSSKALIPQTEDNKCNIDETGQDELNKINFHTMLLILWIIVAAINIPALLTWARNFKYRVFLQPDTSYLISGFVMTPLTVYAWAMDGPRKNLNYSDTVAMLLAGIAVVILAFGPYYFPLITYGVALTITIIMLHQIHGTENSIEVTTKPKDTTDEDTEKDNLASKSDLETKASSGQTDSGESTDTSNITDENVNENANENANENRIYNIFKSLRDKLSFNNNIEN